MVSLLKSDGFWDVIVLPAAVALQHRALPKGSKWRLATGGFLLVFGAVMAQSVLTPRKR